MTEQTNVTSLPEEKLIELICSTIARHPLQRNALFSADAELIELDGPNCLACTTDTLNEEISLGILRDPWTIGWTAVNIVLSDLAAVGSLPLGLLVSWTIPPSCSSVFIKRISEGIRSATEFHRTFVLGGDTNTGAELQLCGTGLGLVPKDCSRQRVGMAPGQKVIMTGKIGLGNALGFARLIEPDNTGNHAEGRRLEELYRPTARLDAVPVIREFATACIDSSDGVLASLDILSRLNQCGIEFKSVPEFYHDEVMALSTSSGIPLWLFAVAEHGEFELIFSVEPERSEECLERCRSLGIDALTIGAAVGSRVSLNTGKAPVPIDVPYLRGLMSLLKKSPGEYIKALVAYALSLKDQDGEKTS